MARWIRSRRRTAPAGSGRGRAGEGGSGAASAREGDSGLREALAGVGTTLDEATTCAELTRIAVRLTGGRPP
ncbi:hypothetical protein AB0D42_05020 [Streptomyces sp. NPDC048304]|uniref:hypothetical protein n=1 Tax=Streptomyces sp. NPDC048304 TaxID=3154820 RepID=UPI0033D54C95